MKPKKRRKRRITKKRRGGNKNKERTLRNLLDQIAIELRESWDFIIKSYKNEPENYLMEQRIRRRGTKEEKDAMVEEGCKLSSADWEHLSAYMNRRGPIYDAIKKCREERKRSPAGEQDEEFQNIFLAKARGGSRLTTSKRRRRKKRKRKTRKKNIVVKIQRGGGFFGDMMKKAGSMAMEQGTAFAKQKFEQGKADLLSKGKSMLNEKSGGMMDRIKGFAAGGAPEAGPAGGPAAPAGGDLGGAIGDAAGGMVDQLTSLIPCDENLRPQYPKGTDGCGKHESPKPTVDQLVQGYVGDDTLYQVGEY